jgi:predicted GH43/DUF377 family glycosyl hydrolase
MPKKEDLQYFIDEGFLQIFSFYDEDADLTYTQGVGAYDFKPILITKKNIDYFKINDQLYEINDEFILNYCVECNSGQEVVDGIDRWILNFVKTKMILSSNNKPKKKIKKKSKKKTK